MRHEADMLRGPIGYLGHFSARRWLVQGHNDIDSSGKQNSADDQNKFVEQNGAANAPGAMGVYSIGSSAGNPL